MANANIRGELPGKRAQLLSRESYSMMLRYGHLAPDHLAAAAEKVANFSHKNRHTARQAIGPTEHDRFPH
jgi:hypothetical protein